jgi:DNA-binding NarL/FixJ family response regulator
MPMLQATAGEHIGCMQAAAHPIKVFLADDSDLICDRVEAMLGAAGMAIVGRAQTPQACFDGILATLPHVVVLDVQLDGGTGLEVMQTVRLAVPGVAFIVFSNNSGPAYRRRYLAQGALQFIDKNSEFADLAPAVRDAAQRVVH